MTSPVGQDSVQWPLLPKALAMTPTPLLVVVHGHRGGLVPEVLQQLLDSVALHRGAPVWIQALTADALHLPPQAALWLVPLLLTPGSHVRFDLPALRQRLKDEGHGVKVMPFLGSWPAWIRHLRTLAQDLDAVAVVHHPLRPGLADRYLSALSLDIDRPLISADRLTGDFHSSQSGTTNHHGPFLALALAPNRMTAQLGATYDGTAALLDHPASRQHLFNLLTRLP